MTGTGRGREGQRSPVVSEAQAIMSDITITLGLGPSLPLAACHHHHPSSPTSSIITHYPRRASMRCMDVNTPSMPHFPVGRATRATVYLCYPFCPSFGLMASIWASSPQPNAATHPHRHLCHRPQPSAIITTPLFLPFNGQSTPTPVYLPFSTTFAV
jgi:hypothetical protein